MKGWDLKCYLWLSQRHEFQMIFLLYTVRKKINFTIKKRVQNYKIQRYGYKFSFKILYFKWMPGQRVFILFFVKFNKVESECP